MSTEYCAKTVVGYYLTSMEVEKYCKEDHERYNEIVDEYVHRSSYYESDPEVVFGIELQCADAGSIIQRDTSLYVSMSEVRKLIEAFETLFPDLPYDPNRTIQEYIICQVR